MISECIINPYTVSVESRHRPVFYASSDLIIYKNGQSIQADDCSGNEITRVVCPVDARVYEYIDLGDSILFIFGGNELIFIDKSGDLPYRHKFDTKLGKIVTPIFLSTDDNCIVFGTKSHNGIQFMNYNFIDQKRISQTSTWNFKSVTDIIQYNNTVYAVLDSTFLVEFDNSTCEVKNIRSETSLISPKIFGTNNGIIYLSQSSIREWNGKQVESVRTPISSTSRLLGISQECCYLVTDKTNISAFDKKLGSIIWEIKSDKIIYDSLTIKGIGSDNKTFDIGVVQSSDTITLINFLKGRIIRSFPTLDAYKIRTTSDHILIHRYGQQTDMLFSGGTVQEPRPQGAGIAQSPMGEHKAS